MIEGIGVILSALSFFVFFIGLIMLIVQAIRKKSKKPALITIITSIYMFVFGFVMFYVGDEIDKTSIFISCCIVAIITFIIGIIYLLAVLIAKRSKKPALITLILSVVIFVAGLINCAIPEASKKPEIEDYVEKIVLMKYNPLFNDNIHSVDTQILDIDEDGNTYTVKGKTTILDDFRDKYVGRFVISLQYSESSGFTEKSADFETPERVN